MRSKTFLMLLIIFLILLSIFYFIFSYKNKHSGEKQTRVLFDSLPVEKVSKIYIISNEGKITLKEEKSLWTVEERFNYTADFSLIMDLVNKIKTMKAGRSFNSSNDSMSRLGLRNPEEKNINDQEKGIRVIISDNYDKMLADIVFGKTRELTAGAGGHYIMPFNSQTIYLIDKKFDEMGKKPEDWIQKNIINIDEKDIKKVVCFTSENSKQVYSLDRPDKDSSPIMPGMPGVKTLIDSKIDDVFTALSPLSIENVAADIDSFDKSSIDAPFIFEYHLYNGIIYNITPGNPKDPGKKKYYAYVKAIKSPEVKTVADDAGSKNAQEVEKINKSIEHWLFEIPDWKFKRFYGNQEDLHLKDKS